MLLAMGGVALFGQLQGSLKVIVTCKRCGLVAAESAKSDLKPLFTPDLFVQRHACVGGVGPGHASSLFTHHTRSQSCQGCCAMCSAGTAFCTQAQQHLLSTMFNQTCLLHLLDQQSLPAQKEQRLRLK